MGITNKLMLVAMNQNAQNNEDSLLWIGQKIQLNEFMDLPNLFGHKLTKIANNLVLTGGISNECGNIGYSETFCYVLPCIDEIVENAINNYLEIVSAKYNKATNSKTYQKQQNISSKSKQSTTHSHSN